MCVCVCDGVVGGSENGLTYCGPRSGLPCGITRSCGLVVHHRRPRSITHATIVLHETRGGQARGEAAMHMAAHPHGASILIVSWM